MVKRKAAKQKASSFSIRASAKQKRVIEQSLTATQQVAEQGQFRLPKKQWNEFCDALDAPPKTIPALRKLLTKPGLLDATR